MNCTGSRRSEPGRARRSSSSCSACKRVGPPHSRGRDAPMMWRPRSTSARGHWWESRGGTTAGEWRSPHQAHPAYGEIAGSLSSALPASMSMDGKPWRCRAACGHRRSAPARLSTPCSAAATASPLSGRRPKLSDSAVLNMLCFFPYFVGVSPRCSQAASQANTYGCVFAFAVLILCGVPLFPVFPN